MTRGFISILSLLVVILVISLGAASWLTWQLQNQGLVPNFRSSLNPPQEARPSSTPVPDLGLEPLVSIDPNVTVPLETIQTRLLAPLRLYYATQPEQLRRVVILPAETDSNHDLRVEISLSSSSVNSNLVFYYDQLGNEANDFPVWQPSLLDNVD